MAAKKTTTKKLAKKAAPKSKVTIKLARKSGDAFRLEAFDGKKNVGFMSVLSNNGFGYPAVEYIEVKKREARIGTRLYEVAARMACEEYGEPLASGFIRTEPAEGFWSKQESKGRAEQRPYDGFSSDELDEDTNNRDTFYTLTCPAPTSLEGLRRRRKRRK